MFTIGTIGLCIILYIFLSWIRRMLKISSITDKYIFISGCDSGFGKALVKKLDVLGANVFGACLSELGQTKLRQETSSRVKTMLMDVTRDDHVRQAVAYVTTQIPDGKGLWALVNNAGTNGMVLGPPDWLSISQYSHVLEVNVLGSIRTTLAFLPLLRQAEGRVINMSSAEARFPLPLNLPSCISKAAVGMFSDGLRQHLLQFGVSVHIVEPGCFKTDMMLEGSIKKKVERGWNETLHSIKEMYGSKYYFSLLDLYVEKLSRGSSPHLNKVISAYVHALTARYPRQRYTVGWDARLYYIPLSYMPSCFQDFLAQGMLGNLVPASLEVLKEEDELEEQD